MGLTVTDLTCIRGGRRVLADLSLALGDGDILLLRGPNGSGKTTLLRALAGLLRATARRLEIDGFGLAEDPDGYQDRLAHAGHLDAVKPQLTVGENLAFWAALLGGDPARAAERLDLGPILARPAHVCSAGQRRRLGLARLLLAPRRIWLLDEPTVSLDAASVGRLLAAIREHAGSGGMAIIATHAPLDLAARELALTPRGDAAPGDPFLAGAWT